jgi:hypothetical protein
MLLVLHAPLKPRPTYHITTHRALPLLSFPPPHIHYFPPATPSTPPDPLLGPSTPAAPGITPHPRPAKTSQISSKFHVSTLPCKFRFFGDKTLAGTKRFLNIRASYNDGGGRLYCRMSELWRVKVRAKMEEEEASKGDRGRWKLMRGQRERPARTHPAHLPE